MKGKLLEWLFERTFRAYSYTFRRSDEIIEAMKDPERREYYRQAKELAENKVFRQEMEEMIRRYYQELSLKSTTKLEQQGYRMALLSLQDLDRRIKSLALLSKPPRDGKILNERL